jgi:aldose sugar dehydrogenase
MTFLKSVTVLGLLFFLIVNVYALGIAQEQKARSRQGVEVKIEILATGLNHPWGMAFLPDDRLLVTERNTGKLNILKTDNTFSEPLQGVPEVWAKGQGGLMDVALDPDFKENHYVYLSYAKPDKGGKATTALGRGRLVGNRVENFRDIFVQEPSISGRNHFGNRMAFSPDGAYLFLGLGERYQFDPAQDLSNHLGAVIRILPNGKAPKDNPFVGHKNAKSEIWSYGHRNIEAMAFQPETGALWVGEVGPRGGDELNRIEKGQNYGWPVVSWGEHYSGRDIPDPPTHPEFKDAVRHWIPVISPSGMIFYQGSMFSNWKNNALIGGLTHKELVRLVFEGTRVIDEDRLPMPERIRDVETAPDGSIYVLTDEGNGKVLRISLPNRGAMLGN